MHLVSVFLDCGAAVVDRLGSIELVGLSRPLRGMSTKVWLRARLLVHLDVVQWKLAANING